VLCPYAGRSTVSPDYLEAMGMETVKRRRGRPPKNSFTEPPKPKRKMPSKRVFICSPLAGNIERNMRNACVYCRFAFDKGFVPIAPHLFYTQFLDDKNKDERAAGLRYGLEEMWRVKQLWVFGENITDGMRFEIDLAKQLKIPVRYFDSEMEETDG
jgi:hypothetical protein